MLGDETYLDRFNKVLLLSSCLINVDWLSLVCLDILYTNSVTQHCHMYAFNFLSHFAMPTLDSTFNCLLYTSDAADE